MNKLTVVFTFLLLLKSSFISAQSLNKVELQSKLKNIITSKLSKNVSIGVSIKSLKTKEDIFSHNQDKQFRPASNMKIVTGAASLKTLGPNYTFKTKIYIDGEIKKTTLHGNLIVKGDGDPTLSLEEINNWVKKLKTHKIKKITGNIIGIDNVFDKQRTGVLWSWSDLSKCFSAQSSGLQINSNCLEISVKPGSINTKANIYKNPHTSYVTIINNTKTTEEKTSLSFKRIPETNKVIISGKININAKTIRKWISINDPTMFTLTLLKEALKKNNIKIKDKIYLSDDIGYTLNVNKSYLLTQSRSKPLKELNKSFLKHSINLYGESFLKKLGFIYFNEGSIYNGRAAVKIIFKDYNLPNKDDIFIADGSGLSRLNLLTPAYISTLLLKISKSTFYQDFFNSLSTSGMSGTLKRRLNSKELKGKIHAKTGYIRNVRTLSGYIDTKNGERLSFSILINNLDGKLYVADKIIKKICLALRNYKN